MTTNIRLLPQISASFVLATNGDWSDTIQFNQADNVTPIDISGISFHGQMRPSAGSPVVTLDLSVGSGSLVNRGANGQLSFVVPAAVLATIAPGPYVLDILAIADGNQINIFQTGAAAVTINQGVTR